MSQSENKHIHEAKLINIGEREFAAILVSTVQWNPKSIESIEGIISDPEAPIVLRSIKSTIMNKISTEQAWGWVEIIKFIIDQLKSKHKAYEAYFSKGPVRKRFYELPELKNLRHSLQYGSLISALERELLIAQLRFSTQEDRAEVPAALVKILSTKTQLIEQDIRDAIINEISRNGQKWNWTEIVEVVSYKIKLEEKVGYLMSAVKSNTLEGVRFLVLVMGYKDISALNEAIARKKSKIIKFLLKHGGYEENELADIVFQADRSPEEVLYLLQLIVKNCGIALLARYWGTDGSLSENAVKELYATHRQVHISQVILKNDHGLKGKADFPDEWIPGFLWEPLVNSVAELNYYALSDLSSERFGCQLRDKILFFAPNGLEIYREVTAFRQKNEKILADEGLLEIIDKILMQLKSIEQHIVSQRSKEMHGIYLHSYKQNFKYTGQTTIFPPAVWEALERIYPDEDNVARFKEVNPIALQCWVLPPDKWTWLQSDGFLQEINRCLEKVKDEGQRILAEELKFKLQTNYPYTIPTIHFVIRGFLIHRSGIGEELRGILNGMMARIDSLMRAEVCLDAAPLNTSSPQQAEFSSQQLIGLVRENKNSTVSSSAWLADGRGGIEVSFGDENERNQAVVSLQLDDRLVVTTGGVSTSSGAASYSIHVRAKERVGQAVVSHDVIETKGIAGSDSSVVTLPQQPAPLADPLPPGIVATSTSAFFGSHPFMPGASTVEWEDLERQMKAKQKPIEKQAEVEAVQPVVQYSTQPTGK